MQLVKILYAPTKRCVPSFLVFLSVILFLQKKKKKAKNSCNVLDYFFSQKQQQKNGNDDIFSHPQTSTREGVAVLRGLECPTQAVLAASSPGTRGTAK